MLSRASAKNTPNGALLVRFKDPNHLQDLTYCLATASYRLLPHIEILKPIPPHLAEKFQKCFSPGVIKVDPKTREVVVDSVAIRNDSVSREVLRHPEFADSVKLSRVRDHFLCKWLGGEDDSSTNAF